MPNDNLHMLIGIIGISGLAVSIILIGVAFFTISLLYLKKPQIAGLIGNISSLSIAVGVILFFIKRGINNKS